ncbi:nucleotidyltransferase family protein [Thermodesulfobacteriota bacterium]
MNAVILAAGYAMRMMPISKYIPKPLLPVGPKRVIEYALGQLERIDEIRRIIIITNSFYVDRFEEWFERFRGAGDWNGPVIELLDDGTRTNEERLGAIGDIAFAICKAGIEGDLMVLGGDVIFGFSLVEFIGFQKRRKADTITIHRLDDPALMRRTGNVEIDGSSRVRRFVEKPESPISPYASPPIYIFKHETGALIHEYLETGGIADAPGNFITWLCGRTDVYAYLFEEERYDIGDIHSYKEADRIFSM